MPSYLTFATAKVKIKLPSHFFPDFHGCRLTKTFPAAKCMFKVSNRNTRFRSWINVYQVDNEETQTMSLEFFYDLSFTVIQFENSILYWISGNISCNSLHNLMFMLNNFFSWIFFTKIWIISIFFNIFYFLTKTFFFLNMLSGKIPGMESYQFSYTH